MDLELPIWKGDIKRATANHLEQCGERIGTLKLRVTYWPGMVGLTSLTYPTALRKIANSSSLSTGRCTFRVG
jgi:hypothetical protein